MKISGFFENLLRALRHRNYRLFFGGNFLSLVGAWISSTAMSWLIYRLTGSSFLLGAVNFLSMFPSLLLGPFTGVQIDRLNRHRIVLGTQILSMVQSFLMAFLTLAGLITESWILWLSLFQGIINAVDMPARQTFVSDLVTDPDDLSNAIALNSALFNGARLIGPAVGGLIIAASSEGVCFLIDGISYLAVVGSLLAMNVSIRKVSRQKKAALSELKEGLIYIRETRLISFTLLIVSFVTLTATSYMVLLPVFAKDIFQRGAEALGIMMSMTGLGAFSGAIYLASRTEVKGLPQVIARAGTLLTLALLGFSFAENIYLASVCLYFSGAGFVLVTASSNTILQTVSSFENRGKVMAFFTMSFAGAMPVASLMSGSLSHAIGPKATVAWGACLCGFGIWVYWQAIKAEEMNLIKP